MSRLCAASSPMEVVDYCAYQGMADAKLSCYGAHRYIALRVLFSHLQNLFVAKFSQMMSAAARVVASTFLFFVEHIVFRSSKK